MDDPELTRAFGRILTNRQLLLADAVVAAGYVGVALLSSGTTHPFWTELAITAAVGLPIAVRRVWPRPVLLAVLASSVAGLTLGVLNDPFLAAALATYPVALQQARPPRIPVQLVGGFGAAVVVLAAIGGPVDWAWRPLAPVLLGAGIIAGSWTLGRAVRERRADAARLSHQLAQRAVTDERLRIARELHDVVAHSMSVITDKAGIANHVAREHPDEAADALRTIEGIGRGALTDMRQLLGVLRSEDGESDHGDAAALGPTPGMADLPALAERARSAGIEVDLAVEAGDDLPEGVALSVYRIAQEALTNVVKHAASARCRVSIRADGGVVAVDVTDDGPSEPAAKQARTGAGHGLVGMYERVSLYDGTFSAGPRPGGGFSVSVALPYPPVEAEAPST